MLDENEKIAKARLAAVQVLQEDVEKDAKSIKSAKHSKAKKSMEKLSAIQKDIQQSISEVRKYFACV